MGTLSKLRRLVLRDKVSIRQASRQLGISRNTATRWLQEPEMVEPRYPTRQPPPGVLDAFKEQLSTWLKADSYRNKRERRGVKALYQALQAMGYSGSSTTVYRFAKDWREELSKPRGAGFVPMHFELGEAFQFDWSCEYLVIGGLRRRLDVAHIKLAASRAYLLVAYFTQTHEMLFDSHARGFAVFEGVAKRCIYDNMRTAVDKVGHGKERIVNARFEAMTGHYLFEHEFCNRAAGWEKGIVEKNVQDRRRGVLREAAERHWASLAELNAWLQTTCKTSWSELAHPQWPELTIADVWQDEVARLMPCPRPFDGYVEQPVRVSSTSFITYQRNRYSVPCELVNQMVSLRVYPETLLVVAQDASLVRLTRSFERDQTIYDWQHYIELIQRKPGALRNGAPFKEMPAPLQELQRQLLKHTGGYRVMAQVLGAVNLHGLEAVLVATELALQAGRVSAEHILNVLGRLKEPTLERLQIETPLHLNTPAQANLERYDALRNEQEVGS